MGYMLDRKKVLISGLTICSFILANIFLEVLIRSSFEHFNNSVLFYRILFIIGLPYSLLRVYILFTLRKSIVFSILLVVSIIMIITSGYANLFGLFRLYDDYATFYGLISNIYLALFLVLLITAVIIKEKRIIIVYISMSLFINIFNKINILGYIMEDRPIDHSLYVRLSTFYTFFQITYSVVLLIILLVIFNRYGIQYYKNKVENEKENQIENDFELI